MQDIDFITQIMDLRSRVDSGLAMLNQILKDGMLLDMFVYISFKCPVTSLTITGKAMQHSFCLASSIIDIVGPNKVSNEFIPCFASIMSLHVWLQIYPTFMVMSPKYKFVKGLAMVDLKCRIIHNCSICGQSSDRCASHHLVVLDGYISSWGTSSTRSSMVDLIT